MILKIQVRGQVMKPLIKNVLANHSQEFSRFVFLLSEDWDGLTTFAQFRQGDAAYNIYLDSENACYLPPEIAAGKVSLMLYGTGEDVIGTTNAITMCVSDNKYVSDAQSTEITESLYQQLVNELRAVIPSGGTVGQVLTRAANGKTAWSDAGTPTREQIAAATDAWLEENVAQETGYVLDSTLTMSNAAPPASAVGDLKSAVSQIEISNTITPTWHQGYIRTSDGTEGSDDNYCYCDFIASVGVPFTINGANGYNVKVLKYNSSKVFLGSVVNLTSNFPQTFEIENGEFIRIQFGLGNSATTPESITSDVFVLSYATYTDASLSISGKAADAFETGKIKTEVNELKMLVPFEYALAWSNGKYIVSSVGTIGTDSSMACTEEYYPVRKEQKLAINLSAYGTNECAVAFYNESKVYDATKYVTSDGEKIVVVPFDGFARFTTKTTQIPTSSAYVKNYINEDEDAGSTSFGTKKYYVSDVDKIIAGETAATFTASSPKLDYSHKGCVAPTKRYLAIAFDDFRQSDFNMVMPLFEKYGYNATFNRVIHSDEDLSEESKNRLDCIVFGGHELGDHTILHYAFPYEDALFNGQNPASVDGAQIPYPTNEQMRGAEGETYNAFYSAVTSKVSVIGVTGLDSTIANTAWKDLTDAQCQTIRETFSALKNPVLAPLLDEMSNYYLGTSGRSDGSWDSSTGKYTGGIFTGCATSDNHEIWERILTIVQMYYKEKYGLNWNIQCWSWPGAYYWGRGFSLNGQSKYYRADMTLLYNMNARFASSLYVDELGNAKVRSFSDVLREFGYKYTHDYIYPGRLDGGAERAIQKQFYFNEHLSKEDGVLYPTNRTVSYSDVDSSYPYTFFTAGKTKAAQMYDGGGVFYRFIEALRHDTAHGVVHGEVIDSTDSYSMKIFLEEALRFCKSAGIDVITKAESYDICFNNPIENGNLIYNPTLGNSAADFLIDATNVPTNPDGFAGNCSVTKDANGNILVTTGETTYIHYGIPLGKIKYSADVKGSGTITVYLIKCGDNINLSSLTQLTQITVDSANSFTETSQIAVVPDNALTTWSQNLEGRDNKVMGIKIVYSSGLQIKNIRLEKC